MDYSRLASLSSPWTAVEGGHRVAEQTSKQGVLREARKEPCLLLEFPLELLVKIFSLLTPQDLMQARLVCRVFLEIATHDDVWQRHSTEIDTRRGGPLAPLEPSGKIWSFMLLYWTRKSRPKQDKTLQEMVDAWTLLHDEN